MVRKGFFVVELVDAEIKFPFSESSTELNGVTRVQVEAGTEYFVRVTSFKDEPVICSIRVDGKHLGYHVTLNPEGGGGASLPQPSLCGLWSIKGGKSTDRALKFTNKEQKTSLSPIGSVQVRFYEAIFDGHKPRRDHHTATWKGGNQSSQGQKTETQTKRGNIKKKYVKGEELATITMEYHVVQP